MSCVVSILMPNCWEGWAVYFLRFIWTAPFQRCTDSAVHTLRLHQTTLFKSSNTESLSSNFRTSITPNFLNEHHVHWRTVSDFLPPALHFHVTKSFFFFNKHPSLCNVAGHNTVNTGIILRTFIPVVLLNQSPYILYCIPVFLNRRVAARYQALASIISGRERFSWNLSF